MAAAPRNSGAGRVDYLVVGSGIAGLWFAHKVSQLGSVLVITKKEDTESNTNYAQGGIAAAEAENDSAELHCEDTLRAGVGLAHPEIVELVTQAGPGLVEELSDVGIGFSTYRDAQGRQRFDLGQEGGHRRRRILHAQDSTGFEIERGLLGAVRACPNVTVSEDHFALDLLVDDNGRCRGVHVLDTKTLRTDVVHSDVTMLATGGIGQAYLHTTNPLIATGDGIAMGFRAGAGVANMEFIQFHPTSLYGRLVKGRAFLITEAMRGEGAILRANDGSTFMERYHPDASLAPRDVVARAIDSELKNRGDAHVLLDATHLNPERLVRRFPNIHRTCLGFGIDITQQPIPVVPAAHYVCGGLSVNSWAETTLPGLFAAGECACTGLHGANRLASNSLLEAVVMADRAARRARESRQHPSDLPDIPAWNDKGTFNSDEWVLISHDRKNIQQLMWDLVGIVRSDFRLRRAESRITLIRDDIMSYYRRTKISHELIELRNMAIVAWLIVVSARHRKESRGLHYNTDYPDRDDRVWNHDTLIKNEEILA